MKAKEFILKEIKRILALAIALGLVILAWITQQWSYGFIKTETHKVLSPLYSADSVKNLILTQHLKDTTLKIATLKNQFIICDRVETYFGNLGLFYFNNYYAFSICFIVFITLFIVALFLVITRGWQHLPLVLKSLFLTTLVLSSISYFLPEMLINKNYQRTNMEKVKVFEKIQFDILSLANNINQLNSAAVDSSISSYYSRISENIEFLTTIKDEKLDNELKDVLKKYKTKN